MRSLQRIGVVGCIAGLALTFAAGSAYAVECVKFEGLEHCPVGGATVTSTSEGSLKVGNFGASGQDGVNISLDLATSWTAEYNNAAFTSTNHQTVFTAMAEGAATSTARLGVTNAAATCTKSLAATFTGAGDRSTYSALVYREGVLQAAIGGVRNGQTAARSIGGGPGCRPRWQTYSQCIQACTSGGWPCGYCSNPCPPDRVGFHTRANGACVWDFAGPLSDWQLLDGRKVQGDQVVLVEEIPEAGSYPYMTFDAIRIQGNPNWFDLFVESIVR